MATRLARSEKAAGSKPIDLMRKSIHSWVLKFLRARFEKLLLARAHCAIPQLLFDDLKTLGDLLLVDAGAIATEQELHHVRRHWILARILPHEILAHQVSVENRCCQLVEMVKGDA